MTTLVCGGIGGPYSLNCWDTFRAFSLQHKNEKCLSANVRKEKD